jgi:hypothetical protein
MHVLVVRRVVRNEFDSIIPSNTTAKEARSRLGKGVRDRAGELDAKGVAHFWGMLLDYRRWGGWTVGCPDHAWKLEAKPWAYDLHANPKRQPRTTIRRVRAGSQCSRGTVVSTQPE